MEDYKTIKQLFPELTPIQRMSLGDHLSKVLRCEIARIQEDSNWVRLYPEPVHDEMTKHAIKLFR